MANVLIADLNEESAYLVRSLLRGRGHASSIAISGPEAFAKLETGLFDTLFIDLCDPTEASLAIAVHANTLLPSLPIVVLTREDSESQIKGIDIFSKVLRPIRGKNLNEAVDRALLHALSLGLRRQTPRITIDLPLKVTFGEDAFEGRITDISPRGFAIDAADEIMTDERVAQLVAGMRSNFLAAELATSKKDSVSLGGRIAFVDRARKHTGKMIGVVIESADDAAKTWLDSLFAPPVEQAIAA